jgi:hypothetical protein
MAVEKMKLSKWSSCMQVTEDALLFRIHASDVPLLAKDIVALDIAIDNFSKRHSLESLFLQLTGK